MPEEHKLSHVVPVLVAVLICDVAVADPGSGKKSLIGIFDRIQTGQFPLKRPMSIYVKLADLDGYYKLQVKFVNVPEAKMIAHFDGEIECHDRTVTADLYIDAPPLPFPSPGRYEFQVWANDNFLGQAFIDAVMRPAEEPRKL